ncbi:MAG: DUF4058 family protein [Gemmataceae bacterium]
MASPFPGMDPYLEGDVWTSFHGLFAMKIVEQLVPKLIPRYVALPEKRYIAVEVDEQSDRYPDVEIRRVSGKKRDHIDEGQAQAPLLLTMVVNDPEPHTWVEIREAKRRKLVTAIEILSPTNKRGKARRDYLEKREQYVHGKAHLIEIDLVRQGKRLPVRRLPAAPYFVFLSRAGRWPAVEVWPIGWKAPLPTIPVPLLPGDSDVLLDLQLVLSQVFAATALDLSIDYQEEPDVPLPKDVQRWADQLLRTAKLR